MGGLEAGCVFIRKGKLDTFAIGGWIPAMGGVFGARRGRVFETLQSLGDVAGEREFTSAGFVVPNESDAGEGFSLPIDGDVVLLLAGGYESTLQIRVLSRPA